MYRNTKFCCVCDISHKTICVIGLGYSRGIEFQHSWDTLGFLPEGKNTFSYPNEKVTSDDGEFVSNEIKLLHTALSQICPVEKIEVETAEISIHFKVTPNQSEIQQLFNLIEEMLAYQLSVA